MELSPELQTVIDVSTSKKKIVALRHEQRASEDKGSRLPFLYLPWVWFWVHGSGFEVQRLGLEYEPKSVYPP